MTGPQIACRFIYMSTTETKGNEMTAKVSNAIKAFDWASGRCDSCEGMTVIAGPNNNELLKCADGWIIAVRPIKVKGN